MISFERQIFNLFSIKPAPGSIYLLICCQRDSFESSELEINWFWFQSLQRCVRMRLGKILWSFPDIFLPVSMNSFIKVIRKISLSKSERFYQIFHRFGLNQDIKHRENQEIRSLFTVPPFSLPRIENFWSPPTNSFHIVLIKHNRTTFPRGPASLVNFSSLIKHEKLSTAKIVSQ